MTGSLQVQPLKSSRSGQACSGEIIKVSVRFTVPPAGMMAVEDSIPNNTSPVV